MAENIKVILDTNILLVSISSESKYHWVFSKLLSGEYTLFVTNEILLEYEEIISSKYNNRVAKNLIRTLLYLDNVVLITPYFKWNLIKSDKDDNKFVDCYVASNSNFLVTHDKHFNCLKSISFPKVNLVNIDEFKDILNKYK